MACLRKRKTKTGFVYHIDYSYKGRRYVMSTKTSDLQTARTILHDIQGKIAEEHITYQNTIRKIVDYRCFVLNISNGRRV